jgi:CRISPR/Cas system-associated endonuclease/helicase Cas3
LDVYDSEDFVDTILNRNDIEIGEVVGSKLDDPILRVIDEGEDLVEEMDLARTTTVFTVEPRAQVFVDEFYAALVEELDDDFEDEYEREYLSLFFLGKLISDLKEPSPGKVDLEDFRERCQFDMEKKGDLLEIDGSIAALELARSLEKNGVLKVKGDSIKWKK